MFAYGYSIDGYLAALTADSLVFLIGKEVNNIIEIKVTSTGLDEYGNSATYKVYLNAADQILAINSIDTISMEETSQLRMAYDAGVLDSIIDKGIEVFSHDIASFDYQLDGNNYLSQKASWETWLFPLYDVAFTATVTYTYSSILNNYMVPLQIPYLNLSYAVTGYKQDDFLLYLLQQNGYETLKNRNLVQTISSHDQAVFFPSEYHDYITNFDYIINPSGQVSEMHVSNPDGTGTFMIYKMTYY
jgi:hypothetical protein